MDYLSCPVCKSETLTVAEIHEVGKLLLNDQWEETIVRGILACRKCGQRYPVLEEAPRLLHPEYLTAAEREVLEKVPGREKRAGPAVQRTPEDLDEFVREIILRDYGYPNDGPARLRALQEASYQRTYAEGRRYQMEVLENLLDSRPKVMLDVGGGTGGNLYAAEAVFELRYGVVADLSSDWPPLFQVGDRRIAYVRADATDLPFATARFDLVVSSFLIEHLRLWEAVIAEMARIGRRIFVAFGPNRVFPFEFGHLDAPLAHCLPQKLGMMVAYLWGRMTGNPRSLDAIKNILSEMNYMSSRRFFSYCREMKLCCRNIFPEIAEGRARIAHGRFMIWLGRYPSLTHLLATVASGMGIEPNIYALIAPPDNLALHEMSIRSPSEDAVVGEP